MNIKQYENFLEEKDFLKIKNNVCGENFPWFFNEKITSSEDFFNLNNFQFVHVFYKEFSVNSQYFELLTPLIEKINPASILKIKANLNTFTKEKYISGYHTDQDYIFGKTAVYYLNTNNGGTILDDENKTFFNNKENSILIFDSNIKHAGISSTNSKNRVLININYLERKLK